MEKEEKRLEEENESLLERIADVLVDGMEINVWTYGNVGNYSMN